MLFAVIGFLSFICISLHSLFNSAVRPIDRDDLLLEVRGNPNRPLLEDH